MTVVTACIDWIEEGLYLEVPGFVFLKGFRAGRFLRTLRSMENGPDEYHTLAGESRFREKIRGSTFLAIATPVEDGAMADSLLAAWRKEYFDSTHIGWARRLAPPPDGEERWDDDGEPHGTTGPPILQAITGMDLWGVLVGVVRWYGGTKLGTGGLRRAYGGAAREALEAARLKKVVILSKVLVTVPTPLASTVYSFSRRAQGRILTPEYLGANVRLTVLINRSRAESFGRSIIDATSGQAEIKLIS